MATFTYKAKDKAGNTVTGNVEAESEKTAAGRIRELGHYPIEIRPLGAPVTATAAVAPISPVEQYLVAPLWTGVNIRQLAFFYRQLATLLASGMSISEALRSVGNRTRGRLGVIIQEIVSNVEHGGRFSDTLARYPHIFASLQVSLIRAGESGGLLDSMVDRIASYLEYEIKVRQMLSRIMIYPVIIFVFIVAIVICVPHIHILIKAGFDEFYQAIAPQLRIWMMGTVMGYLLLKFMFGFRFVKFTWDAIKTLPPVLGTLAKKLAMSRFSKALAVLYAAGLPLSEAVKVASEACANLAVGRRIRSAVPHIQQGWGLTEALEKTEAVLPMVMDMLMVGEKTGSMDDVLFKVADYMDSEADATIHKTGIALFVLCIFIAGVVAGIIAVRFFSDLYGGMVGAG